MTEEQLGVKRKRVCLTPTEKREICVYANEHSSHSALQIANHFQKPRKTISDILSEKTKWINVSSDELKNKYERDGMIPKTEDLLFEWFVDMRRRNVVVTDEILKKKAADFNAQVGTVMAMGGLL
jgi:hypothetical protein